MIFGKSKPQLPTETNNLETTEINISEEQIFEPQKTIDIQNIMLQAKDFGVQLCTYGCISERQISKYFTKYSPINPDLESILTTIEVDNNKVFFHSKESHKALSEIIKIPKIIEPTMIPQNKMPTVLKEIDILLAFCQATKKDQSYRIFDWKSEHNPRNKKMLKVKRCDKSRGTLHPDLAIVLKKGIQGYCIIFHFIPYFEAFLPGERAAQHQELITAYHSFLNSPEDVKKWASKRVILTQNDTVAVALIAPEKDRGIPEDLLALTQSRNINTPIFFSDLPSILETPISCWHTNYKKKSILLKSKKKKKS